MREILFRGKRVFGDGWAYGSYYHYRTFEYDLSERHTIMECKEPVNAIATIEHVRVDPETVGQYTGLTDKNGKRIFEGDIIDASEEWWDACGPAGHDSPIILVKWSEWNCGFDPFANYDCDCGVYINARNCEVIGNIHDNPELMDGESGE